MRPSTVSGSAEERMHWLGEEVSKKWASMGFWGPLAKASHPVLWRREAEAGHPSSLLGLSSSVLGAGVTTEKQM